MNILGVVLMGAFAGFFVASTGMLKDIRYEPFKLKKYIMHAFAAGFERLTVEVWKGFVRKKPSKFKSKTRDTRWLNEH